MPDCLNRQRDVGLTGRTQKEEVVQLAEDYLPVYLVEDSNPPPPFTLFLSISGHQNVL